MAKNFKKQPSVAAKKLKPAKDNSGFYYLVAALLLVGTYFALSFIPDNLKTYHWYSRTWGFNNVSYLGAIVKYVCFILLFALAIPKVSDLVVDAISNSGKKWSAIFNNSAGKVGLAFFVFAVFALLAYLFKIEYHLLGDLNYRIGQTLKGEYIEHDYGVMFTLHKAHNFLNGAFGYSGEQSFVFMHVLSGGIYAVSSLLLSRKIGATDFGKLVAFIALLAFGGVLYFFGYVEIYAMPALLVALFLLFGILAIERHGYLIPAAITLVLAVFFHRMSVALIPAFLVLCYFVLKDRNVFKFEVPYKAYFALILLALPIVIILDNALGLNLSLNIQNTEATKHKMTLFSFQHIWEFINGQFIGWGFGLFCFLAFLIHSGVSKKQFDAKHWFLLGASMPLLIIAFIVDPMRGSADWDILCFPMLAVIPFVVNYFNYHLNGKTAKNLLLLTTAIALVNTVSWIGINSSKTLSKEKIVEMLSVDPGSYYKKNITNESAIAYAFKENKLEDDALVWFGKNAKKNSKDPRQLFNYSGQLLKHGKKDEAFEVLQELTKKHPFYPLAYPTLINLANEKSDKTYLYNTINQLFQAYNANPNAFQRINSANLKNYFNYLKQVETSRQDVKKVAQIDATLSRM